MVAKKRGLGRGLDALLPPEEPAPNATGLAEIPIEWIRPGKYQPRVYFDEESLKELAASIKTQGVIQPIVLRPVGSDQYEIIAGERRWRAAQVAGLEKVPAVVRSVDDDAAISMSLIENIQREDLNPLEEAAALQQLIDEFQFTHQEVAEAVGKSRSAVTNTIRLTHLAAPVAEMLKVGELEMGHARALLTLATERQISVARVVVEKGLNVRQTEDLVRNLDKAASSRPQPVVDTDTRRLEENLSGRFGQPITIKHTRKGKGRLIISYNSLDELDGVLSQMGYSDEP
jgi:ParB family chromosome partitioning protein